MRKLGPAFLSLLLASCGCGGHVTVTDTISPNTPQALDAGQSVTFTAVVKGDPTDTGVSFQLLGPGTLTTTSTTAIYTAPATMTGVFTASVIATPVKNGAAGASVPISLANLPAITTTTLPIASAATAYSSQLASTGGTLPVAWSVSSGALPPGLTISSTGLLAGVPTSGGNYTFSIGLTDAATAPVTTTATYTVVVNAAPLVINSASVPTGTAGKPYSATLISSGGTAPYTWSLAVGTLPVGVALSSAGVLSGAPSAAGAFSFTAQIADAGSPVQTVRKTFSLVMYPLLTATTTGLPNGSVRNAYSTTLLATGGNASLSWNLLTGLLPAGLSLSPAGVISGTPTAVSSSTFTVQVGDTATPQQTATATYTLGIVLSTLSITSSSLPQVTINTPYTTTLSSFGGNPPVTWVVSSGTLPAGLDLSSVGVISGTPTAVGDVSFTVQATDSTPASVTQILSIDVVPLTNLNPTTPSLPDGNTGAAYTTTLAAAGGATPYTWSVSTGTLPPGLTLSAAGVLSGTPYIAGTTTFTLQVNDAQPIAATATRQYTLTVGTTLSGGAANPSLSGAYGFLINGFASGNASGAVHGFGAVGSITADGNGGISGVEDINASTGTQQALAVTGSYSLGTDGRGLMLLTAGGATTLFSLSASNPQGGIAQYLTLSEFDNSTGTGNSASGLARHQNTAAFALSTLNGNFAFGLSGESPCSSCTSPAPRFGPVAAVGLFTANGVATISAGVEDAGAYGQNFAGITLAGSFTGPSSTTGRGTLILTPTGTVFAAPPSNYTYVIVSPTELLLLSTDSHATSTLLYGDAQLQQQAPYTATSLVGRSIGYETQAAGGDGSAAPPASLNAILSQLTITGSGLATLQQDGNRAGVFSAGAATAVTYTTAANGRTVIPTGSGSNQILYLDATGAGFALDLAAASGYPALLQYELQVAVAPEPTLLSGQFVTLTPLLPIAAPTATGTAAFAFYSGGVDNFIGGKITLRTDSSAPSGTLAFNQAASLVYIEDLTGSEVATQSGTPAAIVYAITAKRAVSIPTTATPNAAVTVLQQ